MRHRGTVEISANALSLDTRINTSLENLAVHDTEFSTYLRSSYPEHVSFEKREQ